MYVLNSDITIGEYAFQGVHEVTIQRSLNNLASTAVIKVPVSAVIHRTGESHSEDLVTNHIQVGDPVRIRLGYDPHLHEEFRGYVKSLNLKSPLEIVCEDAFYLTRYRRVTLSGTKTLQEVLQACSLTVAAAETLTLRNFVVKDKSVGGVLASLKTDYGLSVYFDLQGRVYAVRKDRAHSEDIVVYDLAQNIVDTDDLIYQKAEDIHISIRAIAYLRDGNKIVATKGVEDYPQQTLYFYNVADLTELSTLAEIELGRLAYDGYRGQLTAFLEPFAAPGMLAIVKDERYYDRVKDEMYIIDSVETTFGQQGARRKVEIGRKIDDEEVAK